MQDILLFFKKFNDSISKDLQFVIDDISTEDSSALGVLWHLGNVTLSYAAFVLPFIFGFWCGSDYCLKFITEWKGKEFPFSKGCSFYRLVDVDGKKQIM